jgi:hypothetical protein
MNIVYHNHFWAHIAGYIDGDPNFSFSKDINKRESVMVRIRFKMAKSKISLKLAIKPVPKTPLKFNLWA